MVKHLTSQKAFELIQNHGAILIDVREVDEFKQEHIPGALFLPLSGLSEDSFSAQDIDGSKTLIVQCRSGARSARACSFLEAFADNTEIYNLEGGILGWKQDGFPTNVSPNQ